MWNSYTDEEGNLHQDKTARHIYSQKYSFQKLGLYYEDCVSDELPLVGEAISRLPASIREARQQRIDRAILLLTSKKHLPESEHTTPDMDVPYLSPYLFWVENEAAELDSFVSEQEDIMVPPQRTTQLADYDIHSGTRRITKIRFADSHDHGYKISQSTSGHWWH